MVSNSRGKGSKFFKTLKSLNDRYKFVTKESKYIVTELEIKSESPLFDFINSQIVGKQRESQLNSILNDDFEYEDIMFIRDELHKN